MLSAFIVTIFLARKLSIADFGDYSLIKQIITNGVVIANLGLGQSYTRNYAKNNKGLFIFYILTALILSITSLLLGLIIQEVYDYTFTQTLLIILSLFCGSITLYMSEVYRVNNRYTIAQFSESGWKILLLLAVIILYTLTKTITLDDILFLIFLSFLIPSLTFINLLFKSFNEETQVTNLRIFIFTGLTFWAINSAGLLCGSIEKFAIPLILSKEALGIYTSLSFVYVTYFSMIGSAIGYVLFPTLSKGEKVNWIKLSKSIGGIILISSVLFLILGKHLTTIIYGGKYDEYNNWFFIISYIVLGILQLVNSIFHFIVLASGKRKELFIYLSIILVSTGLFIGMIWISNLLIGLSIKVLTINVIGIWLIKITGIIFLLYHIVKRRSQDINYFSIDMT
jgi:O-antigen/teichoic acid export membrane protein